MARVIFNGEAGAVWSNETGKVQYQFLVSWSNSCGLCIQYDHAIGPYWGIPLHRGCRCRQRAIAPGAQADPFVDFREKIDALPARQQSIVVGRSNLKLIERGVVRWEDVVTSTRIRDFREVVALKRLGADTLAGAGIPKHLYEQALRTVHTPAHELAERTRRELLAKLKGAGLTDEQIKQAVGERLARRVTIGGGPQGGMGFAAKPTTPRPPAPKPAGRPLGAVLDVRTRSATLKPKIEETIRAVDSVHGDGRVPRVPVQKLPESNHNKGEYAQLRTGRPVSISVRESGRTPHMTMAHEVGHMVEGAAIPHVRTPSPTARDWAHDEHLAEWHQAVQTSQAVADLKAMAANPVKTVHTTMPDGRPAVVRMSRPQIDYLLKPDELWARSYAQYIATKSQSAAMLEELNAVRSATDVVNYPSQWADDDFGPIARAIDALFKKLGWRL